MKNWQEWLSWKEEKTGAETILPGQITRSNNPAFQQSNSVIKAKKQSLFNDLMLKKTWPATPAALLQPKFFMDVNDFFSKFPGVTPEEFLVMKKFGLIKDIGNNKIQFNLD